MAQLHSILTAVHRPFAAVYADATARLAATGFVRALGGGTVAFTSDDLYKAVLQQSDNTIWILIATTPTWVQITGTGSIGVDNSTIEISGGSLRAKDDGTTNAKLANMAQSTIKGRASGAGTGDPTDLSAAQVKTILALVPGDITGFDTQVRTSRLDQMAAPTADVSLNSHKLTNVTDPGSAQDAATKNYVDNLLTRSVATKTNDYTTTNSDDYLFLDSAVDKTLALLAGASRDPGRPYYVKNINSGVWVIDPNGSENIDGAATISLAERDARQIVWTGTAWETF